MSSSEGEFESADEDFAVEEKNSAKKEKEESVSVKITSDNKNQIVARKSSSEIQSGLLEAITDVKIDTSAEEHSSKEPEIQEKSPEKEDDSKKSNKRSVRKIEKPSREGKPKPMKLGMKLNTPTGPREPSSKESAPFTVIQAPPEPKIVSQDEPKDPEKQSNDGWDFDDWGDSDAIDSKKDQGETKDKDGWDRDDWESDDWEKPTKFDTEDSKKSGGENLYSVFPVLSEISQQKPSEAEKNSGIFQNLSRMIKTTQPSSSYDTFPVLGELGTKQTFSEPPKGEMQKISDKEEKLSSVLDKLSKDTSKPQSWGWKPWGGFSTLLSTASEGVATLTHGLSSVIETGMGVPDPSELARAQKEEAAKHGEGEPDGTVTPSSETSDSSKKSEERSLKFGQLVSGVQQIGNKVIAGGLDTLEGIGKKTMTILQENDPGLMNKRKMLGLESERPVLSQILREAKEKTEETERQMKQMHKHLYRKQLHFETLFDDYCGLVHLEALEILSKQCVLKLQSLLAPLTGKALQEMQETIGEVKELCELPEMEADDADGMHTVKELREKFGTAVEDLGIEVDFREILESWQSYTNWLTEKNIKQSREIHDKALHCLAETTALCVCKMHKLAELILVLDHHSTANEADSLVQLTTIFCWHLNGIAARFGDLLSGPCVSVNPDEEADDPNSLITSIFLEGSNSTSYVQNAFQLFIPILQLGAA